MAETPCGPLGGPEDTGGLLDGVEVLLHVGILPLAEASALVRRQPRGYVMRICGGGNRKGIGANFLCKNVWVAAPPYSEGLAFLGTPHLRRGGLTPEEGPAVEEDMLLIVYEFDPDGSTVCTC